jgi:hypothetical protein
MADPFTITITKMQELGLFKFFFPFMMSSAVFFGLLRKSKIFGDPEKNVAVNGVVALSAAMMIWAYPIIVGVDIERGMATFMMNSFIATVAIMVGLMVAGMFLPEDLGKQLATAFKLGEKGGKFGSVLLVIAFVVGLGALSSSGLFGVFIPTNLIGPGGILSEDMFTALLTIIVLAVGVLIITRM